MKNDKQRTLLIFVAGTTPQIITETIYAMIHKTPPIYPDEVHIITSSQGKKLIIKNLLESGVFSRFCKEFRIKESILNKDSIIVVKDHEGNELDDIKDQHHNECVGNFITNFIREKTIDQSVTLHCSLAGGRKTMSFYMGSAMQLFARPWDKLYHVLVTPEFESNPDFYYKPKKDRILKKDSKALYTKNAEIFLAELPFIRLRGKIPLNGKSFKELVEEGQREIDTALTQPYIKINLKNQSIYIGNTPIDLVPLHIMIYSHFIKRKIEDCKCKDKIYCLDCNECFATISDLSTKSAFERMLNDYRILYHNQPYRADDLRAKTKEGMSPEVLRSNISKINREIKEQLNDETLLPFYSISTERQYAGSRYGVKVEKGKIRIE